MATSRSFSKLALVSLFFSCLILVNVPNAKAAIDCNRVINFLTPCVSYVLNGGAVPVACCNGIRNLNAAAQTTPDRQGVCNCLKSTVRNIPYSGYSAGLAAGLPSKCGVNLPYKISPSTDCNSVK